jgi:hypothetical protein
MGDRVRLQQLDGVVAEGVVLTLSEGALHLEGAPAGTERAFLFSGIERLERGLGREPRFFRNFGVTIGIATLGGGIAAALLWSPCDPDVAFNCFLAPESRRGAFAHGSLLGALIGLPAGLLVGALVRHERWETVALSREQAALLVRPIFGERMGLEVAILIEHF